MQGVILAAGKGTRLKPLTLSRSKAMAPILGKPIVARILEEFIHAGITDVTFVVSAADQELVEFFKSDYGHKVNLHFAIQKERLGMAHALKCTERYIKEHFVMSACDTLVYAGYIKDLVKKFEQVKSKGVLTLMEVPDERIPKTGIVDFDENKKVKRIIEKPTVEEAPTNISSLTIHAFDKVIFNYLDKVQLSKRGEYELQDAIQMLIDDYGPMEGLWVDSRLDLTNPEDLRDINIKHMKEELSESHILSEIPDSTKIRHPVYIEDDVEIGEHCEIGPNVYIESDCKIGNECEVKDTIILKGSEVENKTRVENQAFM